MGMNHLRRKNFNAFLFTVLMRISKIKLEKKRKKMLIQQETKNVLQLGANKKYAEQKRTDALLERISNKEI